MFEIRKEVVKKLVNSLIDEKDVYAPVLKDSLHNFDKIKDYKEINLDFINTVDPIKRLFFRQRQLMFTFNKNNMKEAIDKVKPLVVFGVRKCDLNALKRHDMMFKDDPYYQMFRKQALLIGLQCTKSGTHCFCGSLNLENYGDIMLYERAGKYLAEAFTEKGIKFIESNLGLFTKTEENLTPDDRIIPDSDKLNKRDISRFYDYPGWEKDARLCFSCGACNTTCPTCYCFDIEDNVKMSDLKKGERIRVWSGCQLRNFTRVAGNHVFREDRLKRFKHRIYHQLQWFKERHGINLCVGCGRCITNCPTHIDWVKTLNGMR